MSNRKITQYKYKNKKKNIKNKKKKYFINIYLLFVILQIVFNIIIISL